jgi:hypothetical protein
MDATQHTEMTLFFNYPIHPHISAQDPLTTPDAIKL